MEYSYEKVDNTNEMSNNNDVNSLFYNSESNSYNHQYQNYNLLQNSELKSKKLLYI